MKTNHYGHTVDSEVPITGVVTNNKLSHFFDDLICSASLSDLELLDQYLEKRWARIQSIAETHVGEICTGKIEEIRELLDEIENPEMDVCNETSEFIPGFCKTEDKNKAWYWFDMLDYGMKPDPDAEYSAIVGEVYTQVVRSKWAIRCALCSPCYPGQGDVETVGEFLAYTLPPDVYEDDDPIRNRIFPIKGKLYRIFSVNECGEDIFWSNNDGWVTQKCLATLFTESEKVDYNLPIYETATYNGRSNWQTYREA